MLHVVKAPFLLPPCLTVELMDRHRNRARRRAAYAMAIQSVAEITWTL